MLALDVDVRLYRFVRAGGNVLTHMTTRYKQTVYSGSTGDRMIRLLYSCAVYRIRLNSG